MEFDYSAEQRLLKENIRKFIEKEFSKEYARYLDENEQFPIEFLKKMGKLGYLGIMIPKEYGGLGGNTLDMVIILEELGRGATPLGFLFINSTVFGGTTLSLFGSEEQKNKLLPKLTDGSITVALGSTEPNCGTDILACTTFASLKENCYVLNGQKTMISLANIVDYIITVARTDRKSRKKGVSLFLVNTGLPGIKMRPVKKMPSRTIPIYEIFFTDVMITKDNLIGEFNNGWYQLVHTLDHERIAVAALALGIAQAAFEDILLYAKQRLAFGKPIGQFQVIQHKLADMYVNIEVAHMLIIKAAWLDSTKRKAHIESAMAKLFASEIGIDITTIGLQCMGGWGYTMEYDMQRYFRDIRIFPVAPITNEMIKNMIAESLGFNKSY